MLTWRMPTRQPCIKFSSMQLKIGNSPVHINPLLVDPSQFVFELQKYSWPHFYQTRSAWSMDQGPNKNHSPVNNFAPTVTKFCVMWEGQALPHDTKFGYCGDKIVDSRAFHSWSLVHGSSWSGLIKLGPGLLNMINRNNIKGAGRHFCWFSGDGYYNGCVKYFSQLIQPLCVPARIVFFAIHTSKW